MRAQMTFLILMYCFTGACIGAFLQNGNEGAEQRANENEKLLLDEHKKYLIAFDETKMRLSIDFRRLLFRSLTAYVTL